MSKLEEIYQKNWEKKYEDFTFRKIYLQQDHIFNSMKEYAEFYAMKDREHLFEIMSHWSKCSIEELSNLIKTSDLPKHEEL